jgi:hypothetical protein
MRSASDPAKKYAGARCLMAPIRPGRIQGAALVVDGHPVVGAAGGANVSGIGHRRAGDQSADWNAGADGHSGRDRQPLNTEANAALRDEKVQKFFGDQAEPTGGTAEQYARLAREDFEKYGRLVKELNLKVE